MKKQTNPFLVEDLRTKLAKKRNFKKLQETYTKQFPEIKDLNTPKLWDYLNLEGRTLIQTNPMEEDRLRTVTKWIKGNNLNILNVGFGSGNLEEKIFAEKQSLISKWTGVDISYQSVKNAKKKFPLATFSIGAIDKLAFKKNTFDYVVSLEVLEHIKPSMIFKSLNELHRVLKSGGFLIISVPLNEGLEEMIKRGENPNAHVRIYSPDLIKAELEIAGFRIVKEKKIFAFNNFYKLKTLLAESLFRKKFHYNNIIIFAQKII